jgi:hypothetical protein
MMVFTEIEGSLATVYHLTSTGRTREWTLGGYA